MDVHDVLSLCHLVSETTEFDPRPRMEATGVDAAQPSQGSGAGDLSQASRGTQEEGRPVEAGKADRDASERPDGATEGGRRQGRPTGVCRVLPALNVMPREWVLPWLVGVCQRAVYVLLFLFVIFALSDACLTLPIVSCVLMSCVTWFVDLFHRPTAERFSRPD